MAFNQTIADIEKAFNWSRWTINARIKDKTFIYGKHYIDLSGKNARKRDLRFNLDACQNVFLTPPEKR